MLSQTLSELSVGEVSVALVLLLLFFVAFFIFVTGNSQRRFLNEP
jgi:hypothetical protein